MTRWRPVSGQDWPPMPGPATARALLIDAHRRHGKTARWQRPEHGCSLFAHPRPAPAAAIGTPLQRRCLRWRPCSMTGVKELARASFNWSGQTK